MNGNGKRVGGKRAGSGKRRAILGALAAGALLLTGACTSLSDWSEAPGTYGYGGYDPGGYGFGGYGLYPGGGFYDPFFLSPYSSGYYDPFLWSGPGYLYGYSTPALSGRNRYDGNRYDGHRWRGNDRGGRPRRTTRPPQATTRPGDPPALGWRRDGRGIGSPDGVRYGTVPRGTMTRGTNARGTTPGTSPQRGWSGRTRRAARPQAARPERSAPPERRFDRTPRRAAGNPGWERRSSGGWQGGAPRRAPRGNPGGRRGGR